MKKRIRGRRSLASIRAGTGLALMLAAILVSAPPAGAAGRSSFSLGYGTGLVMRGYWGSGFEGALLLGLWKQSGIHVDVDLVSNSGAFSSGGGAIVDAGVWKAIDSGWGRSILLIGFNFSEGNPYEADLNGFGMHFGFRQEFWLGKHFGIYGRALLRLWLKAEELDAVSPAIGGGITFKF
jgi:hypothetical protein